MERITIMRKGAAHAAPVFSGEQVKRLVRFDPDQLRYTITEQGRALLVQLANQPAPTQTRTGVKR